MPDRWMKDAAERIIPTGCRTGETGDEFDGIPCQSYGMHVDQIAEIIARHYGKTCHHQACKRAEYEGGPNPGREEQQANMRLITAAPDLLEACEMALEFVRGNDFSYMQRWDEVQDTLESSIAKAKGE